VVINIDIFFEIHKDLPREGPGDNISTRKAYLFLKDLPSEPLILDIGCGPGMQTIELAKISHGKIIAIDTYQTFLDELNIKAKKEGLKNKIKTINKSMFALDFNQNEFDIIWSEGAVYIYGFEKALKDWKKYLKEKGYFVVSEASWIKNNPPTEIKDFWEDAYPDIKTIRENEDIIQKARYNLISYFILPEKSWWENYYIPMEKHVKELRKKYQGNKDIEEQLDEELKEIEMYKKYSDYYGYVFYIMKISY
jgi:ubiquinone/menaquinone biosynthesis C-methylase UbiE